MDSRHSSEESTKENESTKLETLQFLQFQLQIRRDMETHMSEYRITHSRRNYNDHIQQVDREILQVTEKGFTLDTFQTEERQILYLNSNC